MTYQHDVLNDPNYVTCLDHGFVGLVDRMGSDNDICRAARVSYGEGTKSINEDRGLIRYLVSHKHTSPIEMAEVKLHFKLPIFVMRQLVRHRTASLNEYSGRYSVMSDEFYVPDPSKIMTQSVQNKQGRGTPLPGDQAAVVVDRMSAHYRDAYSLYMELLEGTEDVPEGVARELARTVLPVANYTELYWKQDLHNLLHLIKLRRDPHAQYEIRAFAEAIYQIIKPLFPLTCEAWEDYVWEATTISRMEALLLRNIIEDWREKTPTYQEPEAQDRFHAFMKEFGMNDREIREARARWGL